MKSNCIVVNGVKDVVIVEKEIDETSLKPEECLIESYVSYISPGTELSRVFGLKKGAQYPMQPGYCCVGKILKKGENVYQAEVGDIVYFSGTHSSHQIYDYTKTDGTLYKLNPATTYEEGAFLNMCQIAMNGILPIDVKLGDTCVILGLGTIGLILSVLYMQMGIKVIAVDPVKTRCNQARDMGVKYVVDCAPQDQIKEIMALTGAKGADIVVDASGLSVCIETGVQIAAKHGHVVLLGSPRSDYQTNVTPIFNAIHMKMLTVTGALNSRYPYEDTKGTRMSIHRNLTYLEGLMNQKIIDVNKFISHRIAPNVDEVMAAYEGLMNKKNEYTGVIINWKE